MKQKKLLDYTSDVEINSEFNNPKSLDFSSSKYPYLLKLIKNPPKSLFYTGNTEILNKSAVALVGTRKPTKSGIIAAKKIAKYYAENGFIIVSGLAIGIDTIAMRSALENGAKVIGVLPSSLNNITPKKNIGLAEEIIKNGGLLISENADSKVQKYHYINRNRIISGISILTIIVETSLKGGTMHTFKFAKEQKRPIIVADLPSEGNRLLIEENIPIFKINEK